MSRTYVAELIVIRIFSLFEAIVEDTACRLVCGAKYCDGSSASLLRQRPTQGFEKARNAMRRYGRTNPREKLRWNRAGEISKNLEHFFPSNEHFVATLLGHGQFISDLRKIRNHIAHGNAGTRGKFQEVVSNYYGARVPALTPGRMLLSSRFSPLLVEQFCVNTRAILPKRKVGGDRGFRTAPRSGAGKSRCPGLSGGVQTNGRRRIGRKRGVCPGGQPLPRRPPDRVSQQ